MKRSQYWTQGDLKISVGNTKLGADTIILNMTPAIGCPSKLMGLCRVAQHCYARKSERLYPGVLPYRQKQSDYWYHTPKEQILSDFVNMLSVGRRAEKIKWMRYNESGDFIEQTCIGKLDYIARRLKKIFGIITYGYSARRDLNFSNISFICRGSGHKNAPHGMTTVKRLSAQERVLRAVNIDNIRYLVCPMDCTACNRCKTRRHINIVFPLH